MSELFHRLEISKAAWVASAHWHRAEASSLLLLFHLCRVRLYIWGERCVELGRCWSLAFSLLRLATFLNLSNWFTANHYSTQTTCFLCLFRYTSNLCLIPYANWRRRLTTWFCTSSSSWGRSVTTYFIDFLRLISLAQKIRIIFEEYFNVFV